MLFTFAVFNKNITWIHCFWNSGLKYVQQPSCASHKRSLSLTFMQVRVIRGGFMVNARTQIKQSRTKVPLVLATGTSFALSDFDIDLPSEFSKPNVTVERLAAGTLFHVTLLGSNRLRRFTQGVECANRPLTFWGLRSRCQAKDFATCCEACTMTSISCSAASK